MAIVKTDDTHYKNIAEKIRKKTGKSTKYTPEEMPGGLDEVYEAGVEAGKKSEHDAFWDDYQQNGNRTNYDNGFGGQGWTPDTFKPKHDIRPTSGYMMFRGFSFVSNGHFADVAKHLEDLGIVLDTSNCTNFQYAFQWFFASRFGKIDLSKCTSASSMFAYSTIYEIDEIVFSESTHIDGMFTDCSALEKVKFSGVITKNGLDMGDCKNLDKASITSIFNTFSTTADISATFSRTAIDKAFTSGEWDALRATRPRVTIMYAS